MRTGRRIACGLAAALMMGPFAARAVPTITVEDAARMCQTGLKHEDQPTRPVVEGRDMCIALIDGVAGTVAQLAALAAANAGASDKKIKAVFCLPESVGYPDLAQTFIDFAKANTQYNRRAAAAIFVAAFAARYPCN